MNVHTKPNRNIEVPLGLRNFCDYKINSLFQYFSSFNTSCYLEDWLFLLTGGDL